MASAVVVSFYGFGALQCAAAGAKAARRTVRAVLEAVGATGRVYVSAEGVNGQVAVPKGRLAGLREALEATLPPGSTINVDKNEVPTVHDAFSRLAVKERPLVAEPAHLREAVPCAASADPDPLPLHASPREWHEKLQDKDAVFVDCRNWYETLTGTFVGDAQVLPLGTDRHDEAFDALPRVLREAGVGPETDVMICCTGGIRCERLVRHLRDVEGFPRSKALKGGILSYAREVAWAPDAAEPESRFHGTLFVFDKRLESPITDHQLLSCLNCGGSGAVVRNCRNELCNSIVHQCATCAAALGGCCSPPCLASMLVPAAQRKAAIRASDREHVHLNHQQDAVRARTSAWLDDPERILRAGARGEAPPGWPRTLPLTVDETERRACLGALGALAKSVAAGTDPVESRRAQVVATTRRFLEACPAGARAFSTDAALAGSPPLQEDDARAPSDALRARSYAERMSGPLPPLARAMLQAVAQADPPLSASWTPERVAVMAGDAALGGLLVQLAAAAAFRARAEHRAVRVLDLGTFVGVTAACAASGIALVSGQDAASGAEVVTVDVDPTCADAMRRVCVQAAAAQPANAQVAWSGKAASLLRPVTSDVDAFLAAPFPEGLWDMVVVDAGKRTTRTHLERILGLRENGVESEEPMVRRGGCVIVDDTLMGAAAEAEAAVAPDPAGSGGASGAAHRRVRASMHDANAWLRELSQADPRGFVGGRFTLTVLPLPGPRGALDGGVTLLLRAK